MSYILSLIAAPAKTLLEKVDADYACHVLATARADCGAPDWLAEGEACDIPFAGCEPAQALNRVRAAFAARALDVNVVSQAFRRKRLLLADMDSTLIEQECIDELAAEIGVGAKVAAITERAMRGEIDFEPALRERVALLAGLPKARAAHVLASRITIRPGARTLVATMRAAGAYAALVSGGFTLFAEPISRAIGFDEARANCLVEENGTLTGEVASPILGGAAKEEALAELSGRLGLHLAETLAVGDGANDLNMVRRAGLGVAFRAKRTLREAAGAVIEHADLTALLFLQGYRRAEFAATPGSATV